MPNVSTRTCCTIISRTVISIFAAVVLAAVVLGTGIAPLSAAETPKTIVATVNGTAITRQALNSEFAQAKRRSTQQGKVLTDAQAKTMRQNILERLIEQELLFQQSQKENIRIPDSAVAEHLAKLKARFPSTDAFDKALKGMHISEADLKAKTRQGLAIQKLIKTEVADKIVVSDDQAHKFYTSHPEYFKQPEQVKASHILIKVDAKADKQQQAAAKKKIEDIQQQIKQGGDFGALAKKYSEGPSGARGGDLGFFSRGQMVKPFEDAAFALKPGQVSHVVKTRFGYHLIKVTGKKAAGSVPYKDVKAKITSFLKQQKINTGIQKYVERLKQNAQIEKSL